MFTSILISIVLIFVAISVVMRIIARLFWNPYRLHRPYFGPYGYYGYGRGYRRHLFPGVGFLSVLAFAALDRIFGRRW
jgi:hypothetical protein